MKDSKPKVGIGYMMGHAGLRADLESKKRRDFTIRHYEKYNLGRYAGLDRKNLDIVVEANFDGNKWKIMKYNAGLFDLTN